MGIVSLILGSISLVISWIPFVCILAFILAIVALILGIIDAIKKSKENNNKKWFAIAGIIISAIAIPIIIIISVVSIKIGLIISTDEVYDDWETEYHDYDYDVPYDDWYERFENELSNYNTL